MKDVFSKQQRLSQRPLHECIEDTVPQRLRPYLLTFDSNGKVTGVDANRYEFWIYRQLRKRLKSGEIYVDDSIQHRNFADELVNVSNGSTICVILIGVCSSMSFFHKIFAQVAKLPIKSLQSASSIHCGMAFIMIAGVTVNSLLRQ